ncbi:MAG: hypothetical protein AB1801_28490 [Chloroflexota bacterium]
MKKYPVAELIKKWEREEINVEQAIGQILLWLMTLVEHIARLEAKLRQTKRPD